MSYVDAFFNRKNDIIQVVERNKKGERIISAYPVKYNFYIKDNKGKYESIFGDRLSRVQCKNTKEFRKELAASSGKQIFESDLNPIFSCLTENYRNTDAPDINICFWDIEVDFSPEHGYASPEEPFMPITAISLYLKWLDTMITLAIPPKTLCIDEARDIVKHIPNTIIFDSEAEMLSTFLDLIEDADVISGWNSSTYDDTYLINRVKMVIGKEYTKKLCVFDEYPVAKEIERYGKTLQGYSLFGRVNMDYLDIYRKYTHEEKASYRLDYIGEIEVNENKVPYEGTLDQLYNNDFLKFIEYNRQDVALLDKIDNKLKYLSLAMQYAHENTVLLPTVMGTVAATEQALINEAHDRGLIIPNRPKKPEGKGTQAAGAYVAYPKKGLCDWVGALDINSLYPSTIRALNMSTETIVGQVRHHITEPYIQAQMANKKSFAKAWEGLFGSFEYEHIMKKRKDIMLFIDWEDGRTDEASAAEIYELIFNIKSKLTLSANGTIFTLEKEGVISGALSKWYAERKKLQKIMKELGVLEDGIEIDLELITEVKKYMEVLC